MLVSATRGGGIKSLLHAVEGRLKGAADYAE